MKQNVINFIRRLRSLILLTESQESLVVSSLRRFFFENCSTLVCLSFYFIIDVIAPLGVFFYSSNLFSFSPPTLLVAVKFLIFFFFILHFFLFHSLSATSRRRPSRDDDEIRSYHSQQHMLGVDQRSRMTSEVLKETWISHSLAYQKETWKNLSKDFKWLYNFFCDFDSDAFHRLSRLLSIHDIDSFFYLSTCCPLSSHFKWLGGWRDLCCVVLHCCLLSC